MALFTLERGDAGPVAVFLHGFCQSSQYWAPTVDRVAAAGMRGLAVDLPGFGRSAREAGPYTMSGLADRVVRLLDERRIERVVLVGGSMGGVVAQQLALRHPQRVERLLLVATGAIAANPAAGLAKADEIAAAPWDLAAVTPIVNGFFFRPPGEPQLAAYLAIGLGASKDAAVEATRSNAQNDTMDAIRTIAVPTMIIQGRHDRARTPEHGALMRDRIPGATLAVIEDAGHTPQLEQPAAFHEAALPFLTARRGLGSDPGLTPVRRGNA
jgi:pimeloyl-ACP methyl ester carboxylesterase